MSQPLSDNEAHDRLTAALEALGDAPGATRRADTALSAARKALRMLGFGLLYASEKGIDDVPGVKPTAPLPEPPRE
jgi:hypothetical protein